MASCLVLSMMVTTQVFFAPAGTLAPAAATIATLTFDLHCITAFLDFKARSTPEETTLEYYIGNNGDLKEETEQGIVEIEDPSEDVYLTNWRTNTSISTFFCRRLKASKVVGEHLHIGHSGHGGEDQLAFRLVKNLFGS
jgi:hypothetical protein